MEDLLSDFVAETQEMLDALAGEIVVWEKDPADRARLDNIFRFFHTVKGNCGFFDFPQLEALSHAAEDTLTDVRSGRRQPDSKLVDAVLAVIDRISELVALIDKGEALPAQADAGLIEALEDPGEDSEHDSDEDAGEVSGAISSADAEAGETDPAIQETITSNASVTKKRTIRLPVELLDRIMSGVSDMVLARNDLSRRLQHEDGAAELQAPFNRLGSILDDVRDAITQTRMQRIDILFSAFPRMVRDLSAELGKQVMVELENGDVELDRELIEVIRDPLLHVIRNAIDHGIETPAERRKQGKREIGLLCISARQTGNEIRIGVIDDGLGIDSQKVADKAISLGLVTPEEVAAMSENERLNLICMPGFSTSEEITSVSGRGVGMDVVRANLEQIGGSLMIHTTPGSGTRILLNVPLTLSIVPSLTVGVADQKFAIARSYIEEVVRIKEGDANFSQVGSSHLVTVRGRQVPCVALSKVLEIEGGGDANMLIVIRLVGGDCIGIAVDHVFEHEELVVKPLAPIIMSTGFYVGNTQMDDGSPVLMLDVSGVARSAGLLREVERKAVGAREEEQYGHKERKQLPILLLQGLDGVKRAVSMQAVVRVERVNRDSVRLSDHGAQVVLDKNIVPLAGVPKGGNVPDQLEILRLSDGIRQIAYGFEKVIDIAAIDDDLHSAQGEQDAAGIALIDGAPIEVLDCHQLFSRLCERFSASDRPTCHVAGTDSWSQEFLRPMIEAAGYTLADEASDQTDIAIIVSEGEDAPRDVSARRVIRLRSEVEAANGQEDSIYRYDRVRLQEALAFVPSELSA